MTINYVYLNFLLKQINLFSLFDYVVFIFLFCYLIILFYSILIILILYKTTKKEKEKLIKNERLLLNVKNLFNNGEINAQQYKNRINKINNKLFF